MNGEVENDAGLDKVLPFLGNDSYFLTYVRGTVQAAWLSNQWNKKSPPNYVERSHALLGRTVDEGRVCDICAELQIPSKQKVPVKLIGHGEAGILAAYAALFDPNVKEVVVIDPPRSHKQGPYFPNVLRILDIPEALGLLAPLPLTILGDDPVFDRTAAIYQAAGAPAKLTRKIATVK